jgi:nucleoside-diphosphate-sugar epimerase
MRRVLVTGATGGLGRNAVRFLLQQGVRVRATGRNTVVGAKLSIEGAEFVPMDLATAGHASLDALMMDIDAVWHTAALSAPWGRRKDFLAANAVATQKLLDAAGHWKVPRFVHISTPAIYFDYQHRLGIPESFRSRRPVNDYARTKLLAEQALQAATQAFPHTRYIVLRPRAIFGPHDQVLLPRLLAAAEQRAGRLPLPRGGQVLLDLTYVDNVVQAMALATQHPHLPSGATFNITNQSPVRLCDAIEQLCAAGLNAKVKIVAAPYPLMATASQVLDVLSRVTGEEPALTPYSVGVLNYDMTLDNRLAHEQLGYVPEVSLQEGIRRTAQWLAHRHQCAQIHAAQTPAWHG